MLKLREGLPEIFCKENQSLWKSVSKEVLNIVCLNMYQELTVTISALILLVPFSYSREWFCACIILHLIQSGAQAVEL